MADQTNDILIKEIEDILSLQGDSMVTAIRDEIQNAGKIASGNLLNSVQYEVLTTQGIVTLNIKALSYLQWIDQGRRPGSKMPPLDSILEWVELRGLRSRKDLNTPPGKDKLPQTNLSLAFVIARAIGRDGIPATGVIQNPFNQTKDKNISAISTALAKGNHNATGKMLEDLAKNYADNNIKISISY